MRMIYGDRTFLYSFRFLRWSFAEAQMKKVVYRWAVAIANKITHCSQRFISDLKNQKIKNYNS